MPQYGRQNGSLDGFPRGPDSAGQFPLQTWQHQTDTSLGNPMPVWNHAFQQPPRQHTPNSATQFDQSNFAQYNNAFAASPPATSALNQPMYAWNGFNPAAFGSSTLDPALSGVTTAEGGVALNHQPHQQQHRPQFHTPTAFQHTIAPSALSNGGAAQYPVARANGQTPVSAGFVTPDAPQKSFQIDLPSGDAQGSFLIISEKGLAAVTESKPLRQFLSIGVDAQEFARVSRSSTTPAAPRRKSRNAIKELAASDPKLLAKLAKGKAKIKTKSHIKAQRIPAPRLPLARIASGVSTPSSVDSASEEDSDYDSSDDELDIIESPPYAEKRPDEPSKAVAYDTVRAVWLPRRKQPTPDQIREGLRAFWEVLSTIRNRWKSDTETLKKAEEAKKNSEIPLLKDRVKSQRVMLESALVAALEHGHPEILRL